MARKKELAQLSSYPLTLILYEAPHRVMSLLEDIFSELGDRNIVVGRELTKKFEEVRRGIVSNVLAAMASKEPKGEFVVLIEGAKAKELTDISDDEILSTLTHMSSKDASEHLAKEYGVSKKELYTRIIELKK